MTDPVAGGSPTQMRETFSAFYLREFPRLVALTAAVGGNRAIAEDLAQEAMLRAHRHWDRIAAYDKPGAWARRVAINLATSALRRRAAEARRAVRLGHASGTIPPPDPGDHEVWAAVRALPARQRAAIALHYLEDRPVKEIAAILECTESTAKAHLHKGRAALVAALADERGRP